MGSTLMDGTEQIIFINEELGEFSGYVFLEDMQVGDTIIIRGYVKDHEDSVYKKTSEDTFSNVQALPAVYVKPILGKVGLKFTAQQTAGTYRTITHQWFKR